MWLVENPNSDVGRDLKPKLGMYSKRAVRLALIMLLFNMNRALIWAVEETVNRSDSLLTYTSISLLERFCILLFCDLQSLNCSCCYLYHAFRKAGNFLIAMNIFCVHNTMGSVISCIFQKLTETTHRAELQKYHGSNRT